MIVRAASQSSFAIPPALRRLEALSPLDQPARAALTAAISRAWSVSARRELVSEGHRIGESLLVLDGWAARVRQLADGRRQIMGFILPGDLVGHCGFDRAVAMTTLVGFTALSVCPLPDAALSPTLERAYAVSRAIDEANLMAQITRLGRLSAYERILDFLLEVFERLSLAGLVTDNSFVMPLTQETLGDTLGLTSVHVNRMLQQARRAGELNIHRGRVHLVRPDVTARAAGRGPTRVFAPSCHAVEM